VRADDGEHPLEQPGRDVDQRGVPAVLREHVGDAVAHRAGAHHGDPTHAASSGVRAVRLQATSAAVPASMTSVLTIPPSGPNAPPSIQPWLPGRYSNAGSGNTYPLTGAANPKARVAFQPKCAPHHRGDHTGDNNANARNTPASATYN